MRISVRFPRTKRQLAVLLAATLAFQSVSCGTLLHPERQGLRSGRLDPSIVVLDGLGLLFFFVPGIIAFAVDFATGAIYLPPDEFGYFAPGAAVPQQLTRIETGNSSLDRRQVESIVRERTGKSIDLDAHAVRVVELDDIEQFPAAATEAAKVVSSDHPAN
ncbi:MAG: hypothetical protein AB7O26_18365 [Planctomycetaceae bacterium]